MRKKSSKVIKITNYMVLVYTFFLCAISLYYFIMDPDNGLLGSIQKYFIYFIILTVIGIILLILSLKNTSEEDFSFLRFIPILSIPISMVINIVILVLLLLIGVVFGL